MNESELKARWESDKAIYQAWSEYVVNTISKALESKGRNLDEFLKTPVKPRLKDINSLIDKAFYRPEKNYTDPYNEIEDKVGARFIVLLIKDIEEICEIINEIEAWKLDPCKHFNQDKDKYPLLFTYQSVHYILRPREEITVRGITIPVSTTCEVQIRTLLQHAHAELTHDAIYKAKKHIKPKVLRTVAKSMALIETTDDFFTEVTDLLNHGPLEDYDIIDRLDGIYTSFTGLKPYHPKAAITIWDEFEQCINDTLVDKIQAMLKEFGFLSEIIKDKYRENSFYQQSTVLFVYWMLKKKKRRLLKDWPFPREFLDPLATDLGISIFDE